MSDKLTEAIKNLIPEGQVNEVAEVVRSLVSEAEEQIKGVTDQATDSGGSRPV